MRNRMTCYLDVPTGEFSELSDTLIVKKDGIVVILQVFCLNEIGGSESLASLKVGVGQGIQHRLREIHIVGDHDRKRLVRGHPSQCYGVPLALTIDSLDQPQQDIQRGLVLIRIASGNA